MERLIALSDSHGQVESLRRAIALAAKRGPVDILAFLGDGMEDVEAIREELRKANPRMRVVALRGNCDGGRGAPPFEMLCMGGYRIFATHGHPYHVKLGLQRLYLAAREQQAAVALYGHTHSAGLEEWGGLWLLNPGAVCLQAPGKAAYGEIVIREDGRLYPDLGLWPEAGMADRWQSGGGIKA